jgi:pilus assembly protein Flp/PilA
VNKLLAKVGRFASDETGASLVEYGLLLGLITALCIAAIGLLGTNICTVFSTAASSI